MSGAALRRWIRGNPVLSVLLAVTAVALGARLYALGARVFYYDEAWFGYWVLQYIAHGDWTYRPILHGPFYARVNSFVFPLLGANDWTARLVPAVIGGGLPLSAWLFRNRLRRSEVAALGIILALNPILLYYSRFMRKDLPLAALMFVTLGLLVRAAESGRLRYAYGAAFSFGWALATKESVLLWILTWAGAAVLVLDRRLLTASDGRRGPLGVLEEITRRVRASVSYWNIHLLGATLTTLGVVVYAYAPRAGETRDVGLWQALGGEFGQVPTVIDAATAGAVHKALQYWVSGSIQGHPYLPYFEDTVWTLLAGAIGVGLLALLGFLWDRYIRETPRDLVGFNMYSGIAAVIGYPLANNLPVPWSTVHAIVPLAVPAAVGAALVARWGVSTEWPHRQGFGDSVVLNRPIRTAVAVLILGGLLVNAVAVGVQTSYLAPHESPRGDPGNEIIYYAQPPAELREPIDTIYRVAASDRSGPDVLYVGSPLTNPFPPPEDLGPSEPYHRHYPLILGRNPLPWYTTAAGADVADVPAVADVGESPAPVVITTPDRRDALASALGPSYTGTLYDLDDIGDRKVVVFVREDTVPEYYVPQ
jgi:uncharacterized protein (TIGR03663 family)